MTTPDFGLTTKQTSADNDPTLGRKFDFDKDRWDLLPWDAAAKIVKVLTLGARKYAPNNWKFVDNAEDRYFAALHRHLSAWRSGEQLDPETKLPHLAHAGCCVLFLLSLEKIGPDLQD